MHCRSTLIFRAAGAKDEERSRTQCDTRVTWLQGVQICLEPSMFIKEGESSRRP